VHFLNQAFCTAHLAEYKDLLDLVDAENPALEDLRALADLLLHTYAEEEQFARRGSLMTRVRLALLQARGEPVCLSELAKATGLKKHGLQGRIKAKAGPWLVIIQ